MKNKRRSRLLMLLIVVIVIVAIGFAGVTALENSKKEAHLANATKIISAAKSYETYGREIPEEGLDAYEDLSVGNITDPWDNEKYPTARAFKSAGGYGVKLEAENGKCNINDLENAIITYSIRLCE